MSALKSFDEIIQEGRKKKANEKLAAKIFGRGSKQQGQARSRNNSPSLASRVQKRPQNSRQNSAQTQITTKALSNRRGNGQTRAAPVQNSAQGISIRGMASGSFTVIALNFAPGTSVSDIESVMTPAGEPRAVARLIQTQPKVIAELVYTSRDAALQIVREFNNKSADGRVLTVYLKDDPPTPAITNPPRVSRIPRAQQQAQQVQQAVVEQVYDDNVMDMDDNMEDGGYPEETYQEPAAPTQPRRAEPSLEDGRYGFGDGANDGYYEDRTGDRGYTAAVPAARPYHNRNQNTSRDSHGNSSRNEVSRGDSYRSQNLRGNAYRNNNSRNDSYRNDRQHGQSSNYRPDNRSGGQGRLASDNMIDRR